MLEEKLVERVKNKDMEAFKQIYDLYRERVYFTSYSILKDKMFAEDALQEVFVKVYKKIHSLKETSKFEAWLYVITLNTSKEIYQKNKKIISINMDEDMEKHFQNVNEQDVNFTEDIVISKEKSKEIMKAIYELPYNQRIPLILFYYNNMSIEQISFIMECSIGTVKSRMFYGKKLLKDKIAITVDYCNKDSERSVSINEI